jgi:hypothetical protein
MALTFSTPAGRILTTKVGLDDIITTYSAAKAVYGWMGGMDSIKFLMSKIPSPFSHQLREFQLDRNLQLHPIRSCILTGRGLVLAHIDNAHESFGGDVRTQLIGSTICALAHECSAQIAVELFAEYLMPHFFDAPGPLTDALRDQLVAETNLQLILNEGAARGLNDLFLNKISELGIPIANSTWRRSQLHQDNDDELVHESRMIGGMLKWMIQDQPSEYPTRSASVARVAVCLQAIGYNIGQIEKWDGTEPPPPTMAAKSLLLVLGGSTPTDPLLLEPFPTLTGTPVTHYQYKTVGSLLLSALHGSCGAFPEIFQSYFERIFGYINTHLDVSLQCSDVHLAVRFEWKVPTDGTSPMARRLAAIYFPKCADFVAACYASFDTAASLEAITSNVDAELLDDVGIPEELVHFRVVTASVAISIASRLAPKDFATVRHSAQLDLCFPLWLKQVCKVIDQAQGGTVELHKAIGVLAAVHVGLNPGSIEASDKNNIAWREGIYAIVPSLLLTMDLNEDVLQLQCIDRFWANVKVRRDGSIGSDMASAALYRTQTVEAESVRADASSALQRLDQPWLGPPESAAPDLALYLSIGTPQRFGGTDLCFIARVEGAIAGTAGVADVLRTLLLSRTVGASDQQQQQQQQQCPVHTAPSALQVLNVKPSWWARDRYAKPVAKRNYTYISVKDDPCWAIILAGQTAFLRGRVIFGCVECVTGETKAPAVLIGFC